MAQAENAKKLDYTPVTYDDQYILMVNQLKKYFPIKGGLMSQTVGHRSEERRVGKEWRSRWSPYH